MSDFGLATVSRSEQRLRMRGVQPSPFLYEATAGSRDRFLGLGFSVSSRSALDRLADMPDSSAIQECDGGSGLFVRMQMLDGFEIDAVWGTEMPDTMEEDGRGLALATAVLDSLVYKRAGDVNEWTMVRHLA